MRHGRNCAALLVLSLVATGRAYGVVLDDREAALHGGNNAEEVVIGASGPPFDLLSIDVERLFGPDVWEIASSAGGAFNLSSVGTVDFEALGADWQNLTDFNIHSSTIPLPTFGTHAIDFDNITIRLVGSSDIVVVDFGVGPVFTPSSYSEDGVTMTAVDSGSGTNHFDIGNFNEDDIAVPEPITLLLMSLGLAGIGFAGRRRKLPQ